MEIEELRNGLKSKQFDAKDCASRMLRILITYLKKDKKGLFTERIYAQKQCTLIFHDRRYLPLIIFLFSLSSLFKRRSTRDQDPLETSIHSNESLLELSYLELSTEIYTNNTKLKSRLRLNNLEYFRPIDSYVILFTLDSPICRISWHYALRDPCTYYGRDSLKIIRRQQEQGS